MAKSTKVLSLTEVAALCRVSQPYISKMLDWGKLRRPLTEARVKAQWRAYERDKRKRAKARAAPAELTSLLAHERARSLELRTGLLNRTLLDAAKVNSDINGFISALRNSLYSATANLPLSAKRAGEAAADLVMDRLSRETAAAAVERGGEAFAVPADPTPEQIAAILDATMAPEPVALPEPTAPITGKSREARSRLAYRRTRNNALEATTIPRTVAEAGLRAVEEAARREMALADIGAPLAGVIAASHALAEKIINNWRAGVEDEGVEDDDEE